MKKALAMLGVLAGAILLVFLLCWDGMPKELLADDYVFSSVNYNGQTYLPEEHTSRLPFGYEYVGESSAVPYGYGPEGDREPVADSCPLYYNENKPDTLIMDCSGVFDQNSPYVVYKLKGE